MVRNHLFRRFVAATLMLMGLFAQFQMVFACELTDGKAKPVCCCDEPGGMSGMAMGCDQGGGCQEATGPMANPSDCCEISYEQAPTATAIAPEPPTQLVLLLDAPQPPPIPAAFALPDFSRIHSTVLLYNHASSPRIAGTETFLLTNRFRI
jgi:hypothetical protein